MFRRLLVYCLSISTLMFWGCDPDEVILPDAPSGMLTIGTAGNEVGSAICAKPGGGYLAATTIQIESDDWDIELLDLDASGNIGSRFLMESPGDNRVVRSVKLRTGGGYLLASTSKRKNATVVTFLLTILDANLNVERELSFGSVNANYYEGSPVGSYVEAFEMPSGGWSVFAQHGNTNTLFRISADGFVNAQRSISLGDGYNMLGFPVHCFSQLSTGEMVQLRVEYNYPNEALILDILDDNGYVNTSAIILADSVANEFGFYGLAASSLLRLPDGNLFGNISTISDGQYFFKFEPNTGVVFWYRQVNIPGHMFATASDANGNIAFAGHTVPQYYPDPRFSSDMSVGTLDSIGGSFSRRSFGGTGSETVGGIAIGADGKIAVIGSTSSYGAGGSDIFIVLYP